MRRPLPNLAPIVQRQCQDPLHPDGLYGVYLDESTGLTVLYGCHQAVYAIEWAAPDKPVERIDFTLEGTGPWVLDPALVPVRHN